MTIKRSLLDTIISIRKYLLACDYTDTRGIVLRYHDVDLYSWTESLSGEIDYDDPDILYIPFHSEHRRMLQNNEDPDFLILAHIADCGLSMLYNERRIIMNLKDNLSKGGKISSNNLTPEERKKRAKKAANKRWGK